MTRQETINKAVAWATGIAQDDRYGYSQTNRWGPDFDCSSFVITAWNEAGVPVKEAGASYTGDMYSAFLKCGFMDVTSLVNLNTGAGLEKGDVLLNKRNHTEFYIGGGKVVKASINELGTTTGGKVGDQSGREIYIGYYYNYPWDCVLRYKAEDVTPEPDPVVGLLDFALPDLCLGDKGEVVRAAQFLLNGRGASCGIYGADGDFGPGTLAAVLAFQRRNKLEDDGIVGPATWAKLLGL